MRVHSTEFANYYSIMEVFPADCAVLTIATLFATSIVGFILKAKILELFSWIWTRFAVKKNISEEDLQKDVTEMKETTDQIVQDWIGVTKLIAQIQNDQDNFISRLQNLLEVRINEILKEALAHINVALEEAFQKNDKRNVEMRQTVKNMQEDIQSMKIFIQALVQKSSLEFIGKASDGDGSAVSEIEKDTILDETAYTQKKDVNAIERETSKLVGTMKECLSDLLKDVKFHLSVDREEENRELDIILTKITEDREDMKKTILQAFCITAEQAKKNYDQFGQIGEEGLKYMAVLNDSTNNMLRLKLDETDDMLKNVIGVVNHQKVDTEAIRNILENMDGQFNELQEKLTQIYQINIEHCEDIALNLERTSGNWEQAVSKIEKMVKQLCDDTKDVKQMFKEIHDSATTSQERNADNGERKEKGGTIHYDLTDNSTIQDQHALSQKQENMIFVYSCWERIRNTSCNVETECHSICKLILGLEQKLLSLNESVEKLDDFIRGLNLDILSDRATSINYDDTAEIVAGIGIVRNNQCHAGDGESQVIHSITNKLRNESELHKMHNASAISNAMKLADIILRNVFGRVNRQDNENFMQSKPANASADTERIATYFNVDEEHQFQNPMEPHDGKVETVKIKQNNP